MRFVTSFGPEGYESYGRTFLETYVEHVGLPIDVYYEANKPDFEHVLVTYNDLFERMSICILLRSTQREYILLATANLCGLNG